MKLLFERPEYLWLLLVIPLIVIGHFYFLRRTKRKAMKFSNFKVLKRITGKKQITKNYSLLFLRVLIVLLAVLASSGVSVVLKGPVNENSYVMSIDTSASMETRDIEPSRIEAAKKIAKTFIDRVPGDASFGLVSFSGVTIVEQTLTKDRNELTKRINHLEAMDAGGTDIPGAIISSVNLLLGTKKGRSVILITDGSNTLKTFASDSLDRAINYAIDNNVRINTIGVGSESSPLGYLPTFYNISGVYDEGTLENIANKTGGLYFHAKKSVWVEDYKKIIGNTQEGTVPNDLTPKILVILLVLIIIDWTLASTRFRPIP